MVLRNTVKQISWCAFALLGLAAACSSDDGHSPPATDTDAGGGTAGVGGSSGDTSVGGGGTDSLDASVDGDVPDSSDLPDSGVGGADTDADANIVLPIPICSSGAGWSAGSPIDGLTSAASQELLSVTPDERSIVWLETDGDAVTAFVADRADRASDFGAPKELPVVADYGFEQGIAISPDGLTLIIVGDDGARLASLHRVSRDDDFSDTVDDVPFGGLNFTTMLFGGQFAAPELSSDGQGLYFTYYMSSAMGDASVFSSADMRLTKLEGNAWSAALTDLESPALVAMAGNRYIVSGVSSDELTLFYWDEQGEKQYAIWRGATFLPFEDPVELGDYRGAIPNQDCTRLYFTNSDGELSVATAQ
jgi:hypothetical protein